MGMIETALPYLIWTAMVAVGGFIIRCFRWVKEGELGAKLNFGRFSKIVKPGPAFVIPIIQALPRIHVRKTTAELPQQTVMLSDSLSFVASAIIVYRVVDAYKALFNIKSVDTAVKHVATAVFQEIMAGVDYEGAREFATLNQRLLELLQRRTQEWGLEFESFAIASFQPTEHTSEVLLHIARVQQLLAGNQLIVAHLNGQRDEIVAAVAGLPEQVAVALILRASGGVPSVVFSRGETTNDQSVEDQSESGGSDNDLQAGGVSKSLRVDLGDKADQDD